MTIDHGTSSAPREGQARHLGFTMREDGDNDGHDDGDNDDHEDYLAGKAGGERGGWGIVRNRETLCGVEGRWWVEGGRVGSAWRFAS